MLNLLLVHSLMILTYHYGKTKIEVKRNKERKCKLKMIEIHDHYSKLEKSK